MRVKTQKAIHVEYAKKYSWNQFGELRELTTGGSF